MNEYAGLKNLRFTIETAAELLATFISLAESREIPSMKIVESANENLARLSDWRETLMALDAQRRN